MINNAARPKGVDDTGLPDDVLIGAEGIAVDVYGPLEGKKETNIRRIYHALAKGDIPHFKLGGRVHARRSSIRKMIERQENGE